MIKPEKAEKKKRKTEKKKRRKVLDQGSYLAKGLLRIGSSQP